MTQFHELIKQERYEELWLKCCGFIDLSLDNFMKIQKQLLLEQLELIKKCQLGQYLLNGTNPHNVDEFREQVPLTTYADYAPYLMKRRKTVLPEKPLVWLRSSGEPGEYPYKWIPVTGRLYQELGSVMLGVLLFSSCRKRGDIMLREHDKYLYALAPSPYLSGISGRRIDEESIFDFLPPLDDAEGMELGSRVQQGFEMALTEGMDICAGTSSTLSVAGERFSQISGNIDMGSFLSSPRALIRLIKGMIKSKLAGRPMLPKDVWSLKGIVAGGTYSTVLRERIKRMWGCNPLEMYACSETMIIATQTWDYQGMTFIPNLNFLEFIPEKDSLKSRENPSYRPETFLLDEVKAGEKYELVVTSFLGGAMVRYRLGDLITITSLRNDNLDIDIPQMEFYSRVDELIDIDGMTQLTEDIIWQALERSEINCRGWAACQKIHTESTGLRLYLELSDNKYKYEEDITLGINEQLKKLDNNYARIERLTGKRPLEVTLLRPDAFQEYRKTQQTSGIDMAQFRMPHVNPPESMLEFLVNGSRDVIVTSAREKQPA